MSNKRINIKDLNRADVLAVLYNASKPQGMGFFEYDPTPMTRDEAQVLLDARKNFPSFDYVKGRVMKIYLSGDELDPGSYDRGNGEGAAESAISALRSTGKTNPGMVEATHRFETAMSAKGLKQRLHDKTRVETKGKIRVVHLGLDDVADVLGPKIDESIKKLDDLKK